MNIREAILHDLHCELMALDLPACLFYVIEDDCKSSKIYDIFNWLGSFDVIEYRFEEWKDFFKAASKDVAIFGFSNTSAITNSALEINLSRPAYFRKGNTIYLYCPVN